MSVCETEIGQKEVAVSGRAREEFQAQAWAVIHYAKLGHAIRSGPRRPLVRYRRLLDQNVAPLEAAEKAFGAGPAQLADRVLEYVGRDHMSWISVQPSRPASQWKPELHPLSRTQTVLALGWLAMDNGTALSEVLRSAGGI